MPSSIKKSQLKEELSNFKGTKTYHQSLDGLLYTDGIKFLAKNTKGYWLLDLINLYQKRTLIKAEDFQIYKLTKLENLNLSLEILDCNRTPLIISAIENIDFPLEEITIWCIDGIILLPSEY